MKKELPFIIAEAAQGYEGSDKLVQLYVKAAALSGADAVKFQIFYADEIALEDYPYYQLFKNLELPFEVWNEAVRESHKNGLEFYSDVFGVESFKSLEKIGVDGYKIHSTDINNTVLLKVAAQSQKKIFVSTGGCRLNEIDRALDILNKCDITLMYGFQAEPTQVEDNNLNRIKTLMSIYHRPVGFHDHTAGGDALAFYLPFIAVGEGVCIIEKHLTLSRQVQIEDYVSALTPEEFVLWSTGIKKAYLSLGKGEWELTEKEQLYKTKVRRAVCSFQNIDEGKVIEKADLTLKRSGISDVFFELSEVVGRKAKRFIKSNLPIRKDDVL